MASSASNVTCGVCSGIVSAGQAIFTAECSHSFHFPCIGNFISFGNRACPLCNSFWNHLPFTMPFPNPQFHYNNPFQYNRPVFEPLQFNDDEPLPAQPASSPSPNVGLQKLTIKAVPERPAVASSESVSLFTVLVGLKALSMASDDAGQRAPVDIVTVLDVSGSMQGRKLDLVKRAVGFVIDNLGVSDRLSIVSFSDQARRLLPLQRMSERGKEDAKRAVDLLRANGGTNIVDGLKKGAQVLGDRRYKNPVSTIIFLSDGNDTYNSGPLFSSQSFQRSSSQSFQNSRNALPGYLHLLPASLYPKNRGLFQTGEVETIPVHSFGFGSDHDPITMHAISDASGGTFSFIESYEMVQDAFAGCIGGLLSVVAQEVRLKVRSASHGVEIKSIPSGRHASQISSQGSDGLINIGDIYADEEKEFLINLSIPILPDNKEYEQKTSLLDIMCSYKNAVSKEMVEIEGDLVEIRRPKSPSLEEMITNMEIDRQRNRLRAAEAIKEAQEMAERGDLRGAKNLLAMKRSDLLSSPSAQAGDGMCMWLGNEMKETERLMGSPQLYLQSGRAYALSGMSSHASQRATTRGNTLAGGSAPGCAAFGGGYATVSMANMVNKSQQLSKSEEDTIAEKH